jgi:hypothetical protein
MRKEPENAAQATQRPVILQGSVTAIQGGTQSMSGGPLFRGRERGPGWRLTS